MEMDKIPPNLYVLYFLTHLCYWDAALEAFEISLLLTVLTYEYDFPILLQFNTSRKTET
jgi:hypothetical protein